MAEKNYITPEGYKKLVDELTELATVERPRVVREVSDAAAEGDRSENAAYIYGKRRLREIDRRLGFLQRRLRNIQVVKLSEQRTDRVFFGAFVTIEDEEGEEQIFQIVGVDEVEAGRGRISWKSPVGRALLGKQIDDTVTVKWHAGQRELTVVGIAYEAPGQPAAPAVIEPPPPAIVEAPPAPALAKPKTKATAAKATTAKASGAKAPTRAKKR